MRCLLNLNTLLNGLLKRGASRLSVNAYQPQLHCSLSILLCAADAHWGGLRRRRREGRCRALRPPNVNLTLFRAYLLNESGFVEPMENMDGPFNEETTTWAALIELAATGSDSLFHLIVYLNHLRAIPRVVFQKSHRLSASRAGH